MSRLDEPVDRGQVVQSARMTVGAHYRGTCQCCTPDGCPQLDWAREQLTILTPHRRPVAPDDRRSKENGMTDTKWRTLRCDNSGPNCPQIMEADGNVYLRDSENPMDIAVFPAASFETLKQKIRNGEV